MSSKTRGFESHSRRLTRGFKHHLKYPNRQNKNIQLRESSSTAISPTPRQTADGETKEKILAVCKNQKQYVERTPNSLLDKSEENASIVYDYIIAEQTELNIKDSTKEGKIKILIWLSNFHENTSFGEMTKQNILDI